MGETKRWAIPTACACGQCGPCRNARLLRREGPEGWDRMSEREQLERLDLLAYEGRDVAAEDERPAADTVRRIVCPSCGTDARAVESRDPAPDNVAESLRGELATWRAWASSILGYAVDDGTARARIAQALEGGS